MDGEPEPLNVQQVSEWARGQLALILQLTGSEPGDELLVYRQAAKVVEEVGELHAELLGRSRLQRASKGQTYDAQSLSGEFADVIITLAVLAETVGVDLATALRQKMTTIDARTPTDVRRAPDATQTPAAAPGG